MTENDFNNIQEKLGCYQFTSLAYTDYEDISSYQLLIYTKHLVMIGGYNETAKQYEYHFAANKAEDVIEVIHEKNSLITFIPREWIKVFEQNHFIIRNEWRDYWRNSLENIEADLHINGIENEAPVIYLQTTELAEASSVTQSCKNKSRGFTGEREDFFHNWIEEEDEDNINKVVIIEKNEKGKIVGLVCTSTYGFGSEKGPVSWIREVCVNPEYQNRGIARRIIKQALLHGKTHGATRAFLAADEQNVGAIHLYRSLGFEPSKEAPQTDMLYLG